MIGATPTLLSPAQIASRLAAVDQPTAAAIAKLPRGADPAPIAVLAAAATVTEVRAKIQITRRLPPAVRLARFLLSR